MDSITPGSKRTSTVYPSGYRFGRGVVIEEIRLPSKGARFGVRSMRLQCDCGTIYEAMLGNLLGKTPTLSCGCLKRELSTKRTRKYPPGYRFGRGTIIKEIRFPSPHVATGVRGMELKCDCGKIYRARLNNLKSGHVISCGCLRRELFDQTTHGLSRHPLYGPWKAMLSRCENPDDKSYADYGGRGISVCKRWHDPKNFISDIENSIGSRPTGRVLDRINNNGNYEQNNVKWSTYRESNLNRRRDVRQKLDPEKVLDILNRLSLGESGASISRSYNVSESSVSLIKRGKTWKHTSKIAT